MKIKSLINKVRKRDKKEISIINDCLKKVNINMLDVKTIEDLINNYEVSKKRLIDIIKEINNAGYQEYMNIDLDTIDISEEEKRKINKYKQNYSGRILWFESYENYLVEIIKCLDKKMQLK